MPIVFFEAGHIVQPDSAVLSRRPPLSGDFAHDGMNLVAKDM